ncbi:hypothetical protein cand_035860 [Cryptosporidium andersoni]|uniref:ER membrane protein complex subunit 10 n=1 Tax=Cryptosporidium andersoni TaxID=117008 RepID=A0A1J4MVQ6_9CRYT|nr:hypothetical protein cand_035860 [Cryptosporidium andersoni]
MKNLSCLYSVLLLLLISEVYTNELDHIDVEYRCNNIVQRTHLDIQNNNKFTLPLSVNYSEGRSSCIYEDDGVLFQIPNLNTFIKSKIASEIILTVFLLNRQVIGLSAYSNLNTSDNVIVNVEFIEQHQMDDIKIEPLLSNKSDNKHNNKEIKNVSFMRRYWWLFIIGIIIYSILSVDPNTIEGMNSSTENSGLQRATVTSRR